MIFSVGGTIDKVYFDKKSEYEVGDPRAASILAEANVTQPYRIESIMRKDSLDMTDADRHEICAKVAAASERMIVITHGTDTMAATGVQLAGIENKTIVLTGAIEPAMAKTSDATFNVGAAFLAVQTLPPGTYIVMNGRILDPLKVKKNRKLNRFDSIE
jgi:L-asparaginase